MADDKVHLNDVDDLFTDKIANDGVRFPIHTADGRETDGWLLICHSDSDRYDKAALAEARRRKDIEQIKDEDERRAAIREGGLRLTAATVIGWSFSRPCTQENVIDLLRRAKYMADDIDSIAFNRARFYGGASSSSPATPKRPTDSTDPQPQNQKSPSDNT